MNTLYDDLPENLTDTARAMRQTIKPVDPDFAGRLEQKMLQSHAALFNSPKTQNPPVLRSYSEGGSPKTNFYFWSNPIMRKFTFVGTPVVALAIIMAVIFNPFGQAFNSQDFLNKAYASYEDDALQGGIHYQKTQYLVGKDQVEFEGMQRAKMEAEFRAHQDKYAPDMNVGDVGFSYTSSAPMNTETQMWQDKSGNFLYVTTDLETGGIVSSHLTRMDAEGKVQVYFNESPMINGIGAVTTATSTEGTGVISTMGEASAIAVSGGVGSVAATPVAGTISGSNVGMLATGSSSFIMGMSEGETGTTDTLEVIPPGEAGGPPFLPTTMSVCIADDDFYAQSDSQKLYEQLDQLHKEKNGATIKAILESLKANKNVTYQAAVREGDREYQVYSVVVTNPMFPDEEDTVNAMIESSTTRLYFDSESYRLVKEVLITTIGGKDYELGTTIFAEDTYINADIDRIFDPNQFDLKPAYSTSEGAFEIISMDSTKMPKEPGCYTLGEDGETWVREEDGEELNAESLK